MQSPLQIRCKFYNDFYALRVSILIKDHPVTLQTAPPHLLECNALSVKLPLQPLLQKLSTLLAQYGISSIISVFPDPFPLLEISFEDFASIRKLLSTFDDITPHVWLLVWDSFAAEAKYACTPLLKDERVGEKKSKKEGSESDLRLQYMFRPGNSCQLQLFHFSPNSSSKEVRILPVTLANYELARKAVANSLVFDFQSAMKTYNNVNGNQLGFRDSVLLDDLKAELSSVSGWFHIGILTRMPLSTLMGILFNFRHRGVCHSQLLGLWYRHNTDAQGESQLSWSNVARVMTTIGKKSTADSIARTYGISMKQVEPLVIDNNGSAHARLLADPLINDSLKHLSLIEDKIIEKRRLLSLYTQQRKALDVSMEHLETKLKSCLEDARYAVKMKKDAEGEIDKYSKQIQALKSVLGPLSSDIFEEKEEGEDVDAEDEKGQERQEENSLPVEQDAHTKEESNEEAVQSTSGSNSAGVQEQLLLYLMKELINSKDYQTSDSELASVRINSLLQQIGPIYESIDKEYNLLVSKCHQINELELSIGLLESEGLLHELTIDHHLQSQVAIKTKSETKVLRIQKEVIELEMTEEKKEILTQNSSTSIVQSNSKEVTERQEEMETLCTNIEDWMNKWNSQTKEERALIKDEEISQLLDRFEETSGLQKSLLKRKMSSWSAKKSHRLTAAERNVLQQVLDSLKAMPPEQATDNSGPVTSDKDEIDGPVSIHSVPVECTLSSNETVLIIMNQFIKFMIPFGEKSKLNPKKHQYTVDIKSFANDSTVSQALSFDDPPPSSLVASFVFQPVIRGRHQLVIKSNGKIVKGPKSYSFYAKQDPAMLGYPVRVIEGLSMPCNVTIVPNSTAILVSECKTRSVTLRDKTSGKVLQTIGTSPTLRLPNGIGVDKQGFVYVVDSGSHSVHTFNHEGDQVSRIGGKGDGESFFDYPYGIHISPVSGSISVCDHGNNRVQIFSPDMKLQQSLHAVTPYDIVFDKRGHYYVTDNKNHLIAVFNESLQCINSIAGKGEKNGQLLEPRGIAVNEEGFIFVAEEGNNRISVFNPLGEFVVCFGQEGSQPGDFSAPKGIAVDDDGYIYVCDMLNNRVQVF